MSRRRMATLAVSMAALLALVAVPVAAEQSGATSDPTEKRGGKNKAAESKPGGKAAEYCESQGGKVVDLRPYLNAGQPDQVRLASKLEACRFSSGDGDATTQITVDLVTLNSKQPTLAGLAYLAQVPSSDSGVAGSNPAASYCPNDLGGTEQFGTSTSGGWIDKSQPEGSQVVDLCVFADRSAIDGFGIFYASGGDVRGVDLSTVMRYQPDGDMPDAFSTEG